MKIEIREIKGFTLENDAGIFAIISPEGKRIKACLSLDTIFGIFLNENINIKDLEKPCYSIKTNNTTLIYEVIIDENSKVSYLTSQWAEVLQDFKIYLTDFRIKE